MTKISGYSEDTSPTTDDYGIGVDTGTSTTKKWKWLNAIAMIFNNIPTGIIGTASIADAAITPVKMNGVDLSGVSGNVLGTGPPTANTGQFYMQAGSNVATTNSAGNMNIAFGTAFPNGILSISVSNGDGSLKLGVQQSTVGTTGFSIVSEVISGPLRVNWIAIGY